MNCWEQVGLDGIVRELLRDANDFTSLLFDFFSRLEPHTQETTSMILWSLWKSRNSKLWEDIDTPSSLIIQRAHDSLHEWRCLQRARQPNQNIHQDELWVKPSPSRLKCNVDCALFNNNTITGLGICFQDSSGALRYGLSKYSLYTSSPSEVEALSLLEALTFADNQGMTSVIFESDCKLVVDAIISTYSPLNEFEDIISRCKTLLASHSNYSVTYVRRQANRVAHSIARASLSHPSPYLFHDVLDYLYPLIINEMN